MSAASWSVYTPRDTPRQGWCRNGVFGADRWIGESGASALVGLPDGGQGPPRRAAGSGVPQAFRRLGLAGVEGLGRALRFGLLLRRLRRPWRGFHRAVSRGRTGRLRGLGESGRGRRRRCGRRRDAGRLSGRRSLVPNLGDAGRGHGQLAPFHREIGPGSRFAVARDHQRPPVGEDDHLFSGEGDREPESQQGQEPERGSDTPTGPTRGGRPPESRSQVSLHAPHRIPVSHRSATWVTSPSRTVIREDPPRGFVRASTPSGTTVY